MAKFLERRTIHTELEIRAQGTKVIIEGYAAVFSKRSENLGGFVEIVERSAFNKTVQESDVRALYNHDPNMVLGRVRAGTLQLSIDDNGLFYRAQPPDTSYAKDLLKLLERRDISQSSFQFWKVNDSWDLTEEGFPQRHLIEVGLVEVSPVTFPAYEDATSGLSRRAALDGLVKRSGIEIIDLADESAIKEAILKGIEPGQPSNGSPRSTSEDNSTHQRDLKREAEKAAREFEEIDDWYQNLFK